MNVRSSQKSEDRGEGELNNRVKQAAHYEQKLAFETDSYDLHTAIEADEDITIVDTRSAAAFENEHIPGAVHLPHGEMSKLTTAEIDDETLVITYCDGIGCNASTKGARNMLQLGFEVRELIGGISWWKRDGYETHLGDKQTDTHDCGCA